MRLLKFIRRLWARISQPGTGGLIQPGDWCCVYNETERSHWVSYGDAANLRAIHGGSVVWRYDQPEKSK